MQMYEVTAMSEDMQTVIRKTILFADNEEDAIDRMQELLKEQKLEYGICMASEM